MAVSLLREQWLPHSLRLSDLNITRCPVAVIHASAVD